MQVKGSRSKVSAVLSLVLGLGILFPAPAQGQAEEPVVHAVLFYSPTCPHCHDLINNHLIPLQEQYGRRLVILAFDVTQGWANEIYWGMLRFYEIPQESWVVPIVVVKDEVLIGGDKIPSRLAQIIEEGLAGDGVDLPNLPPLLTFLEGEGMLDPRYPDRRIVVQEPAQAQEAAEEGGLVAEPPPPAGDSAPEMDTLPPAADTSAMEPRAVSQDTLRSAPDTQAVAPEAALPDTEPVGPPTGAVPAATVGAGDSADSPVPERVETAVSSPASSSDSSSPTEGGAEEERAGERPSDSVPPGASPAVPPPGAGAPAARRDPSAARPTDLAAAVQEMESMTMMGRFNRDRGGNSLSVLVLVGMLVSLILRGWPPRIQARTWPGWVVPVLVVVGAGVAAYLSFIEVTQSEAACGPVGDCNTVNQSEYATLFGFLPVGVLGLVGYASILVFWGFGRLTSRAGKERADLALWGLALAGTLFSVYLTFLEPFVIGATCLWCLSSAVIMTLLLWATSPSAALAWPGLVEREE